MYMRAAAQGESSASGRPEDSRKDVFVVKDEAVSMRDSLEVDSTAAVIPPPKKKVLLQSIRIISLPDTIIISY